MPAIHESAHRLLERVFIETWGNTSPVKLTRGGRAPMPPYVELSAVWREVGRQGDDERQAKGLFTVQVFVRAERGMDTALELMGRAVEMMEFRQFLGDGFTVKLLHTRVAGSAGRMGNLHSLMVHFNVLVEATD